MEGLVYAGINNIYRVRENSTGEIYQCRIKGKVLRDDEGEFIRDVYNPLAPGDLVEFEKDEGHAGQGMITQRHHRDNWFCRLNIKRRAPQYIAANIDSLLCFTSVKNPPFRPRFLDRVLIAAELGGVKPAVVVNKTDLGMEEETEDRLAHYEEMGLDIFPCSAVTGEGLDDLNRYVSRLRVAVFGQSGVGKSTLLNALEPGIDLKTSELSDKYDRGRHTTNYSLMIDRTEGGAIIDTPGIRQLFLWGVEKEELGHYFPEMEPYWRECRFSGCLPQGRARLPCAGRGGGGGYPSRPLRKLPAYLRGSGMMRLIPLLLAASLLVSCLTLTGDLEVYSAENYQLTLDYSVKKDFASVKYLASNAAVIPLPLTEGEWTAYGEERESVEFLPSYFQRSERGGRIFLRVRLRLSSPDALGELLSCKVGLEDNPRRLTLEFDRGAGTPSEEAVTYINGYCAGEEIRFTLTGPGGGKSEGSWPLRELLLADDPPMIALEWEE